MEPKYLSINEAHHLLVEKKITATQLVQYYLDRIKKYDPIIKACLHVCATQAIDQAKEIDKKITAGKEIGLLEGIPYTAKDMFLTAGIPTTAASKILQNFNPPYSATAIEKLNEAGAILIAKVNHDEFAHGGSTENSAYEKTTNPWDKTKVPGGSSGGSAAAVAADFGIFSLGTDTGGSIRQPAAFCGVTGLKPTYGRVSRYGVIAMASSFDCVGPIARSAEDAEIVLKAIEGRDQMDSTTINVQQQPKPKQLKVAVLEGYENSIEVKELAKALNITNIKPVSLQSGELMLAAYYILVPSEISSNLERYDGIRYGQVAKDATDITEVYTKTRDEFLGPEVKRRVLTGTYALSAGYYDAYYRQAMKLRTLIRESMAKIFAEYDIFVSPTTVTSAFEFGANNNPIEMYKTDLLTVNANLAGTPAISVPAGEKDGLPLGLQIMAAQGNDNVALQTARDFQTKTDWHQRRPKL